MSSALGIPAWIRFPAVPTDSDLRAQRFGHYEAFAATEPEHYTELEAMALVARLSQILAAPYQIYFDEPEDEPRDESQDRIHSPHTISSRAISPSSFLVVPTSRSTRA